MSLALQMRDYRLTTAEILYHMPDHPAVLQSYIWQNLDLAPQFPELRKFLDFWTRSLDGKLHSVRVGLGRAHHPAEMEHASCADATVREKAVRFRKKEPKNF